MFFGLSRAFLFSFEFNSVIICRLVSSGYFMSVFLCPVLDREAWKGLYNFLFCPQLSVALLWGLPTVFSLYRTVMISITVQ